MPYRDDSATWCGASDAEVIEAVLRGDTERYGELVTRYQLAAWKLAYSFVGNAEDARDISQNAFVNAFRHLRAFRKRAQFSTWLYRIIVNECKDLFKRNARQPRLVSLSTDPDDPDDPLLFEMADPAGDPSDALTDLEVGSALAAAINNLAGKQRTAFVLHHLNGLSLEEVSTVMGCRIGTVKTHLFRACEHLRARLAPYASGRVAKWPSGRDQTFGTHSQLA